jgi:radical SAM protein with 4Fe4S-binding SPASM domain
MTAMKPAEGWSYVEGAVNCAFYQTPGSRVIQLSRQMSDTVRRLARGASLDEALRLLPEQDREQVAGFLGKLPCLVEGGIPGTWEMGRAGSPAGEYRPRGAFLELTERCNLRCRHCYAEAGQPPPHGEYTTSDWLRVMDSLVETGFPGVVLTGGEPLVRPDFEKIYLKAVELFDDAVTILSNGVQIDEHTAGLIREHGSRLSISFYSHSASRHDAMTGVPGSFDRLVEAFRLLLDRGVSFTVNIVLHEETYGDLPGIREFLTSLGIDESRTRANPVLPAGRGCAAKTDLRLLRNDFPHEPFLHVGGRESRELSCPTCWQGQITITPQGRLLLCNMLRDLSVGELGQQDLGSILASARCQSMWSLTLDQIEGCNQCELRFSCYDCRAAAALLEGNLYGRNPLCRYDPLKGEWRMAPHVWQRADLKSARPRPPEGWLSRKLGEDMVVCNPSGSGVFSLNQAAARIWSLCDGQRTVEEIARVLFEEFEVEMDRLLEDVVGTVNSMVEQGILVT